MKKALIIGGAGFVGNYLIDHIQKNCIWSIVVTKLPHEKIEKNGIEIVDLDITDQKAVKEILEETQPDYIFHLAAQSSVALSWKNPALTVDVNIKGTLCLLEAVRQWEGNPRILLIGSGEEYGYILPFETPIKEDTVLRPGNIYAATKACQNMIGAIYARAYQMDILMVRAFNHIGPGQAPLFVVADFCSQVAEIEAGIREPIMRVGNLSAKRDFTDVRDVVRAYCMLMEKGQAGATYNVGSGQAIAIQKLLEEILSLSFEEIRVEIDKTRFRPSDVPIIEADVEKLHEDTGWRPEYSLKETLQDTLNDWRRITKMGEGRCQ